MMILFNAKLIESFNGKELHIEKFLTIIYALLRPVVVCDSTQIRCQSLNTFYTESKYFPELWIVLHCVPDERPLFVTLHHKLLCFWHSQCWHAGY